MRKHKSSKKYAKMFLNAAGIGNAPKALEELTVVDTLMKKSEDFNSLLLNPAFDEEERNKAIAAVGRKLGFSENTVKFVRFLSDNGTAWAVNDVLSKAIAVYSEMKSQVKATVITPTAIGTAFDSRIKESLRKITEKEVEIEYEIDPTLIGGMLIKVGSTMFDGSIKGQLRLLREELVKG